jgi:hypothetical protein
MRTSLGNGSHTRLMLALLVAVVVAACSGSTALLATAAPAANPGDRTASGAGANGGAQPGELAPAQPAPTAGGTGGSATTPQDDLKIVYTGTLELVVADMAPVLAQAKAAVAAAGGYIGASQEANAGDHPTATITYRIPAARWEDTIAALRGLATKVVSEQTQAAEVGGQIVDLEARIANLRASEAALQDIAKSTARVTDLLEVQAQLTDVRGQIEQLDAQRARLADQTAYGTLVTTFGLEVAAVQDAAKGWDPASDVDAAAATLISAGQRLVSGAIWFGIVWLPVLLLVGLLAFAAWRLWRRFGPKGGAPAGPVAGWTGGGESGSGQIAS